MTAPNYPTLTPGYKFRLYRFIGSTPPVPGTYTYLAADWAFMAYATTKDLTQTVETEGDYVGDFANPANLPTFESVPKGYKWDLTFSGKMDHGSFALLEGDFLAPVTSPSAYAANFYLLAMSAPSTDGYAYYGQAILKNLKQGSSNNGVVSVSGDFEGQNKLNKIAFTG
jgi:hypothetical protein